MAEVVVRGLHKRFGENHVVRGVDLRIAAGEVVCLLGPSGCGKTTCLRMIAGLDTASEGEIRIGDTVVSGDGVFVPPERRRLGMVFQSYAVWPHMDVLGNVAYPLKIAGVADARARAMAALDLVHLTGLHARYPHELSGGQQQRVALARAIVAEPQLLLLDEPLSNLDARLRQDMRDEIRALVRRLGVTVLLVTHDQEEALGLSDRVAVMDGGVIQQIDRPEVLYESPRNRRVARFVGVLDELTGQRDGDGVRIGAVRVPARPTEDAPEGACVLGFRPEQASLSDAGIPGVVEDRIYLGAVIRCRIRVGAEVIVIDGGRDARPGDEVFVQIRGGIILPT